MTTTQPPFSDLHRFSAQGLEMLSSRYLLPGETPIDLFNRVASAYSDNKEHSDRILSYMLQNWFMPATPILSNGGTTRGLEISCFLNSCEDNLNDINDLWSENTFLAAKGGGIGSYWGNIRSKGEYLQEKGTTSGIIPFLKVMDSQTLAISQGSLRRGSAAAYIDISHPEIEEFIDIRRPTGDSNRRCLNLHHGVVIDDKFMEAVQNNSEYDLLSPKDKSIIKTIRARELWIKLLSARIETGEPYILFKDTVNRNRPHTYKELDLAVNQSNLCVSGETKMYIQYENSAIEIEIQNLQYFLDKYKNIKVLSKNLKSGKKEFKEIKAFAQTSPKAKIMRITDEKTGKSLECTPEHQIFTKNRGYVMAKNLKEDDELEVI